MKTWKKTWRLPFRATEVSAKRAVKRAAGLAGPYIWTNTKHYLVTIHVQANSGTQGFKKVRSQLIQNFAVVIP